MLFRRVYVSICGTLILFFTFYSLFTLNNIILQTITVPLRFLGVSTYWASLEHFHCVHEHLCCEEIYTGNYLPFLDEFKALLCQNLLARKHFKFFKKPTDLTGRRRNPTRRIELMSTGYNIPVPSVSAVRCPVYLWSY